VISAERFARERSSYWSQRVPRLESFVRSVNLGRPRFSPPIASDVAPERRAFIAEVAFELLKLRVSADRMPSPVEEADAVARVRDRIAVLGPYPEEEIVDLAPRERKEVMQLLNNLLGFLRERTSGSVVVSPQIAGCGVIDRCAADLLIRRPGAPSLRDSPFGDIEPEMEERLLYEVKVVDRPFRAIDFRQLITYAALMGADSEAPHIVGLVNPRLGTYFECTIDELAMDAAGVPADELLQDIVFEVSSAEISL